MDKTSCVHTGPNSFSPSDWRATPYQENCTDTCVSTPDQTCFSPWGKHTSGNIRKTPASRPRPRKVQAGHRTTHLDTAPEQQPSPDMHTSFFDNHDTADSSPCLSALHHSFNTPEVRMRTTTGRNPSTKVHPSASTHLCNVKTFISKQGISSTRAHASTNSGLHPHVFIHHQALGP